MRALVPFYESIAEPLARMFGVLGRWGDETELDAVVDAILTIATKGPDESTGRIHHLRLYPAVLVLSAYGVALAIARRWRALYTVLSHASPDRQNGVKRIVDKLFLQTLDGYDDRIWQRLPDLERHFSPMSDHLYDVLDKWRSSFAPIVSDFAEQFDIWEILASTTYCENAEWGAPVGRNGWRRESRARILNQVVEGGDLHVVLCEAGFGGREGITRCIERYVEHVAKLPWW